MKKSPLNIIAALLVLFSSVQAQREPTDSLVIEGLYNGENIFVKNSFGAKGIGFCVHEVKVNHVITTDEINATLFQINLQLFKLKMGDKVRLVIRYAKGCAPDKEPLLINPGALLPLNQEGKVLSLVYDGVFKWGNLVVCNTRGADGAYGIKEVLVNGKAVSAAAINADIFEIRLVNMALPDKENKTELKEGDKVKIEFKYLKGCDPIILNPEAIR